VTITGNLMVMISFKMDKQLQTISNYFLFSLAVADIIIGTISMPLFTGTSLENSLSNDVYLDVLFELTLLVRLKP
jgi:hypothetical protein